MGRFHAVALEMGRSDPWRYLRLAAEVACLKVDARTYRLGAVGLRSDGVMVVAYNGTAYQGKTCRRFPAMHAEARLARKLDFYSTVYVTRVMQPGMGLARPCLNCQRALRRKRVERVYYTISDDEYGVLELD